MSAELTEIVTSISRAANTVLELDIWLCYGGVPEDDYPPQRRVEDSHRDLRDAATQFTQTLTRGAQLAERPLTNPLP